MCRVASSTWMQISQSAILSDAWAATAKAPAAMHAWSCGSKRNNDAMRRADSRTRKRSRLRRTGTVKSVVMSVFLEQVGRQALAYFMQREVFCQMNFGAIPTLD